MKNMRKQMKAVFGLVILLLVFMVMLNKHALDAPKQTQVSKPGQDLDQSKQSSAQRENDQRKRQRLETVGADKSKIMEELFQEWKSCDIHTSETDRKLLARKTLTELSLSDDLVAFINKCMLHDLAFVRVYIEGEFRGFVAEYHDSLINSVLSMNGDDDQEAYGSFWYQSEWSALLAEQCNEEEFEKLTSALQGVPLRKAVERYAAKLSESDPMRALELVLSNLPPNAEPHRMRALDGGDFDISSAAIDTPVKKLTEAQCVNFLDMIVAKNGQKMIGQDYYFTQAFGSIFDRFTRNDPAKAVELIANYPTVYSNDSYGILLNRHRDDPQTVMQHVPKGSAYDTALSHVTVPSVPRYERTDGQEYVPGKADYARYISILDSIQALADASDTAPCKERLLQQIEEARNQAQKLANSVDSQ